MHDPASDLLRISLPRTPVNKGVRKKFGRRSGRGQVPPLLKWGRFSARKLRRRETAELLPAIVGGRVSGGGGGCYDVVGLGTAVRPGGELVVAPPNHLRRGGAYGVVRAHDHRPRKRRRPAGAAYGQLEPRGLGPEAKLHRLRVEAHTLGVRKAARVGGGEPKLQVGGVLVIWRNERATGHTSELLHHVLVAVGRAVVHDQGPRQSRIGECAVLLVCGRSGEGDRVPNLPGGGGKGGAYGSRRRGVAGAYFERLVEGVGRSLAVGDPEIDSVGASRVGLTRIRQGGVVVGSVSVEVPSVGQGAAFWVGGGGSVEFHRQGGRTAGGVGLRDGLRRTVASAVLNTPDSSAREVRVEEVSVRADLQVDRARSTRDKGAQLGRVWQPVGALLHNPDALARVVGEEQGAVVCVRVGACVVECQAGHRGAAVPHVS